MIKKGSLLRMKSKTYDMLPNQYFIAMIDLQDDDTSKVTPRVILPNTNCILPIIDTSTPIRQFINRQQFLCYVDFEIIK
jgi:hypothetical protein